MRAVVYTRQSVDHKRGTADEGRAVTRQQDDCLRLCRDRGWSVVEVVCDNDVSASSGRVRPGFERVMSMVDTGAVDVVVVWHVDRMVRRLAELEDVITRVERAGVRLATVSGDIDLSTDAGRLVGRILASVARGEVERKSARQARANEQRAVAGEPVTFSHRPFGYLSDKVTPHPVEARAVADAADLVLSGGSLRSVSVQWNAAGLRPPQGGRRWLPSVVRQVLLNPRIAGLATYRGEIVGAGSWSPIVAEQTYRALVAFLTDPTRTTAKGVRTLLGGLARCRCGTPAYAGKNSRGARTYRCSTLHRGEGVGGGHVSRKAAPVEDYVRALVIERLAQPDAVELLRADQAGPDVEALRTEARALRARLDTLAVEFADGALTASQLRTATERVRVKLGEVETGLADAGRVSMFGALVGAVDVPAAWDTLDLDRRRAVIDALMTITLHSPGVGAHARRFDPTTVVVTWRAGDHR